MRCRKADLTLATRARKRELCSQRYVSRMTRTEYFPIKICSEFFGNQFSPRFMLPCEPKMYLRFFPKSAPTFQYTILDSRLPLVMRSRKAGLRLATRPLHLEVRIENDSDQIFCESKFVHSFLETNFLRDLCYPFRSLHLPLDTHFWTQAFPLVMRSRKASLSLTTRARKRELCPQRYVSRMIRTENFLSQNVSKFIWKPIFSIFQAILFVLNRKYFSGFQLQISDIIIM